MGRASPTHAAEFLCRSAANRRKRRPNSAAGQHGQNGLKRLITIRFSDTDAAIFEAETQLSAVDSGIGEVPPRSNRSVDAEPLPLHRLLGAEKSVAGVAEPGENVALPVEAAVERRGDDRHVGKDI